MVTQYSAGTQSGRTQASLRSPRRRVCAPAACGKEPPRPAITRSPAFSFCFVDAITAGILPVFLLSFWDR